MSLIQTINKAIVDLESLRDSLGKTKSRKRTRLRRGNSSSGYVGIYYVEATGNWVVHPTINGERTYLGTYTSLAMAKRVLREELESI